MVLLILGIAIWVLAHFFKRMMPERRAELGSRGKIVVAVAIWVGLILIIVGYRGSAVIPVWSPPSVFTHLNNVLMLAAFYSFGIGASKGRHAQKIRHPMLMGVKIWAVAHLMVNGDLASILLFGAMLAWAVAEVVMINKAEPVWTKPEVIKPNGDLKNLVIALVLYVVVSGVHVLLGYSPFG